MEMPQPSARIQPHHGLELTRGSLVPPTGYRLDSERAMGVNKVRISAQGLGELLGRVGGQGLEFDADRALRKPLGGQGIEQDSGGGGTAVGQALQGLTDVGEGVGR